MNTIWFYKMIISIAIIGLLVSTYAQERDMVHNTVDTKSKIEFNANIPKKKNIGTDKEKTSTVANKKSDKTSVEQRSTKKSGYAVKRSKS